MEVKRGQNSADMRREGWENWAKGDGICAEWRDAAKRIKSRWSENKHVGKRQRRQCWKQIGLSMLLRTGCKAETGRGKPPQQNKWRRGNGFSLWCEWTRESARSEEFFVVLLRCVLFRARKKELWWHFLSRIPSSTTSAYVNAGCPCWQLTLGWTPLKLFLKKMMSCPYSHLWQPWGIQETLMHTRQHSRFSEGFFGGGGPWIEPLIIFLHFLAGNLKKNWEMLGGESGKLAPSPWITLE